MEPHWNNRANANLGHALQHQKNRTSHSSVNAKAGGLCSFKLKKLVFWPMWLQSINSQESSTKSCQNPKCTASTCFNPPPNVLILWDITDYMSTTCTQCDLCSVYCRHPTLSTHIEKSLYKPIASAEWPRKKIKSTKNIKKHMTI